jgi:hypothetical protein
MTRPDTPGRQGSETVEELARKHPSLVVLARTGWFAKGVVYALVGVLAFKIALDPGPATPSVAAGGQQSEASQSGAISEIARTSLGEIALWAIAFGLLLYALWRIVSILLPAESSAKTWITRVGYGVSALVYTFLAFSAISFARNGRGGQSENARIETFTRDMMDNTAGRWIVGGLGVLLVGIALFFLYRVRLGQIGWVGRAAMMALIGAFLVRAAVKFNPAEAEGLDGALHRLAQTSWGPVTVALVGAGLVLYGLYCVLSAPVQRLKNAD